MSRVSRNPKNPGRTRQLTGAISLAGAGTLLAAAAALRRWERSELAREELAHLPDSEHVLVTTADGAEISATSSRPARPNGEGALFVLAHGWTNDRRVWAPVARRLVDSGHHVVCYDHRGHGASTVGSSGLSLEALASDMLSVLEHIDARDAVVAGHSMGGMTAQAMATLHRDSTRKRVGAMVLVATACAGISPHPIAERLGSRLISHRHVDRAMRASSIGPFLVRGTCGREACRAHLDSMREMFVATAPEVRSGFLEVLMAMNLSAGLPEVDLPVTVVAGERDRLLPRRHSHRIASLVPGSRLVEIPHAGHMLPLEVPDRIAALLYEAAQQRSTRSDPRHDPRSEFTRVSATTEERSER